MGRMRVAALTILAVGLTWAGIGAGGPENDEGRDIYRKKCVMCHGKEGVAKPVAKGAPNFSDPRWQEATSPAAVETVVREGRGKMPGYADRLSPDQIAAVARYVKSIR